MKIVNIKELAHMPNGTVFSQIVDDNFGKCNGDMDISGLNILTGHDNSDKYLSEEAGHFCSTLDMLDCVSCFGNRDDGFYVDETEISWTIGLDTVDTADHDFDDDDYFIVYDKDEVFQIIKNLEWALSGCKYDREIVYDDRRI